MAEVPVTKQQYVYATLRDEIQTGSLLPGDRLTVAGLAERFGVSAIPVREALRQLEQEGLVEMTPHVKVSVRGVTVEEAVWAAELRLLLEPVAAREATPHVTKDVLDTLTTMLEAMDRHVAAGEFDDFLTVNRRFHDSIYAFCPNRTLVRLIGELWDTAQRFRTVYRQEAHLDASRTDHQDMVDGLRAHDSEATEVATRRHRERNLATLRAWARARSVPDEATAA